jgi:diacylglycerol kinase
MKPETPLSFIASVKVAGEGIITTFRQQRNFKIHVGVGSATVALGLIVGLSSIEWCVIMMVIAAVLAAELINTAVEATVDLVIQSTHPMAKIAKDAAAGAVLIVACFAAIIGMIIFAPKCLSF